MYSTSALLQSVNRSLASGKIVFLVDLAILGVDVQFIQGV